MQHVCYICVSDTDICTICVSQHQHYIHHALNITHTQAPSRPLVFLNVTKLLTCLTQLQVRRRRWLPLGPSCSLSRPWRSRTRSQWKWALGVWTGAVRVGGGVEVYMSSFSDRCDRTYTKKKERVQGFLRCCVQGLCCAKLILTNRI